MKSMTKFAREIWSVMMLLTMIAFMSSAQAHEYRNFGNYVIGIGSSIEPPLVGQTVGIEVYAVYNMPDGTQPDLDTSAGDIIEINVIPATVATDSHNAAVVELKGFFDKFSYFTGSDGPGVHASGVVIDADDNGGTGAGSGYLTYYLTGYFQKKGYPGQTVILSKYVCGNGSLDLKVGGTFFSCVNGNPF